MNKFKKVARYAFLIFSIQLAGCVTTGSGSRAIDQYNATTPIFKKKIEEASACIKQVGDENRKETELWYSYLPTSTNDPNKIKKLTSKEPITEDFKELILKVISKRTPCNIIYGEAHSIMGGDYVELWSRLTQEKDMRLVDLVNYKFSNIGEYVTRVYNESNQIKRQAYLAWQKIQTIGAQEQRETLAQQQRAAEQLQQQISESNRQTMQIYQNLLTPKTRTNCNSTVIGNTVSTSCY